MAVNPIQQVLQMLMQQAQQNPRTLMQIASAIPGLLQQGGRMTMPAATDFNTRPDPRRSVLNMNDKELQQLRDAVTYEKQMDYEMTNPPARLHPQMEPLNKLTPQKYRVNEDIREILQESPDYKYNDELEPELEPGDPPDLTGITPEMAQQFAAAGIGPQQFMQLTERVAPQFEEDEQNGD